MATNVPFAQVADLAGTDEDAAVVPVYLKNSYLFSTVPVRACASSVGSTFAHKVTYGTTQPAAATRAVGSDYTALAAEHTSAILTAAVMGNRYGIDRVMVGAARGEEVKYQLEQAVQGVVAKWNEALIFGDSGSDATQFDGIEAQVTFSGDNLVDGSTLDLTTTDTAEARGVIAALSDAASRVNGQDGVVFLVNRQTLTAIRRTAAIAGYMTASEDAAGRKVQAIDGVPLVDLGSRSGSNNPVIPVTTGTADIYVARFAPVDGVYMFTPEHLPAVRSHLPAEDSEAAVSYGWTELVSGVAVPSPNAVVKVEGVTIA